MSNAHILPGLKDGKPQSKIAIYNAISAHAKEIIQALLREMVHGDNSNARVSAAKALLAKIAPDLKSIDMSSEEGIKFLIQVVQDNKLKDAHANNTIAGEELPSSTTDLSVVKEV